MASLRSSFSRMVEERLDGRDKVHRRRGGEVLMRLLALARAPVELAEAEVAVGDEGALAKLGRECEGLLVLIFGGHAVEPLQRHIGNNSLRSHLAAAAPEPTSGLQCTMCKRVRLVKPCGRQIRLTGKDVRHQDATDCGP
jgi:hypothetical protein